MKLTKQRPRSDGAVALDCGVCVIAMLTDLPYDKILADMPNYMTTSDFDWMRYLNLLGFEVTQVDENSPPLGHRLYCGIDATLDGKKIAHAIAVNEDGGIFDPSNGGPAPGMFTLAHCVAYGTFRVHCCFAVRDRRLM